MKVSELIEKLKEIPQDYDVQLYFDRDDSPDIWTLFQQDDLKTVVISN